MRVRPEAVMTVEWKVVQPEHVARACEALVAGTYIPRAKPKGLLVRYGGQELSAKEVLRLAYCIAKGMPLDTQVRFASGDKTIHLLRKLGFQAERRQPIQKSAG
jgi:hypothetical protein